MVFIQNVNPGIAEMAEGSIKKLMEKGFGFIKTGGEKDLFFHSSAVQGVSFNDLREGQKVTYTEGMGKQGPCAENVKPI
jgi:CspA family cold shock protein